MGREHELGQVPPPAAAHLGQRSVVPGLQEVVGDSEGLPVGADGRRQRHRRPCGVGEAPGVGEALGDVTENGGFEGHSQCHRLGPPHLRVEKDVWLEMRLPIPEDMVQDTGLQLCVCVITVSENKDLYTQ